MPKEELVEGLRLAVERGEPLNKAMMSFFNAGYLKAEIEEAARALQAPHFAETQDENQLLKNNIKPGEVFAPGPSPGSPQRVSGYEDKPKPLSAVLIFVLVFFLLLLLGLLVAVFLFKDQLTTIFNNLFA